MLRLSFLRMFERPWPVLLATVLIILSLSVGASAQSLEPVRTVFIIGDYNGFFSWPLRAYQYLNGQLTEAETWQVTTSSSGAIGLAVDPYNAHLFVSYENYSTVDVFDAADATALGQVDLSPAANICGMDVHLGRGEIYAVTRSENTVFVFDSDTYAPVDQWTLPTGQGAYDIKIVENVQGTDALFVSDASSTVRWYDIDTHEEIGNVAQSMDSAVGIAAYVKEDGDPIVFTVGILVSGSNNLFKMDPAAGTEDRIYLMTQGRGLYVDQNDAVLFCTVGGFIGMDPSLRSYDIATFTEIERKTLPSTWNPCDVKGTWLSFGSTIQKSCTSHPDGNIDVTNDVVFQVKVKSKYSRPIHVLPLSDQYDTTQLTFVSSTPPVDDPTDDGEVGWADLIPIIGHDLVVNEEYTITLNFKAEPENCTSGHVDGQNLAIMSGAQDDTGAILDDASGSFAYKIWCNCLVDADCDDGVYCNGEEKCVDHQCTTPGNPCPIDDGLYCNGQETLSCVEATHECGHTGDPCAGQGDSCNPMICNEDSDSCIADDDPCPDDALFCNGVESCAENKIDCQHSGNPCGPEEVCIEETDQCLPLIADDDTEYPGDEESDAGWPKGHVTGGCCGCG